MRTSASPRPVLLFNTESDRTDWWRDVLSEKIPGLDFRTMAQPGDLAEIEYVLAWNPPPGYLAKLPNLKAIFSLGAGVDHLFKDPDLPRDVPVSRVVNDNLTLRMREYVVQHVLNHHRQQRKYDAFQRQGTWEELHQPHAGERRVGVMGLGELGRDAAEHIAHLGFDVAGWSRSRREIDNVTCFAGQDEFDAFLARTDILVGLLPLTADTRNLINADTLGKLPAGASFINAGRGQQVVEDDLLAALDSGHLSEATLDVFQTEPLPAGHRLWTHPNVTVTPHIASITDPRGVADQVAENIGRAQRGEPLRDLVDPARGY